jgi:hypothetical protein
MIGNWVNLYHKFGYKEVVGYIVDFSMVGPVIRIVQPAKFNNATTAVNLLRDDYKINFIDIGELSLGDIDFLIDASLVLNYKKWFMELTELRKKAKIR